MKRIDQNNLDDYSFHDNHIHGFSIAEGEHGCGNFILDIDYITEWINSDKSYSFMIAPALLSFHDVFNLKISIDYQAAPAATQPPFIRTITCTEKLKNEYLRKTWVIELNWPQGEIVFEASGFELQIRSEPVKSENQCLDLGARNSLLNK